VVTTLLILADHSAVAIWQKILELIRLVFEEGYSQGIQGEYSGDDSKGGAGTISGYCFIGGPIQGSLLYH
jgi:hypothetical protein